MRKPFSYTRRICFTLWDEARARQASTDLFREGKITGEGIVTPIVSFDEAPEALVGIFSNPEKNIKVGIRF